MITLLLALVYSHSILATAILCDWICRRDMKPRREMKETKIERDEYIFSKWIKPVLYTL